MGSLKLTRSPRAPAGLSPLSTIPRMEPVSLLALSSLQHVSYNTEKNACERRRTTKNSERGFLWRVEDASR